jgi:hypothetical protein
LLLLSIWYLVRWTRGVLLKELLCEISLDYGSFLFMPAT